MVENVLQTDEREDLLTSLTMLNLALAQTEKDLSFWKWAVIATHNALQSAMVCHLGCKGCGYLLVRKKDVKEWFEAQDASTPYPKDLDSFLCLYEKIKNEEIFGYKFTPQGTQNENIEKINEWRDEFVHFKRRTWAIEVSGFPNICKDSLDVICELDDKSVDCLWEIEQHSEFSALIALCLDQLDKLECNYHPS